jgi:multimeric flavodoxin WrbA
MGEMMKRIVVLGISGSPRKQSNTRLMVEKALEGARKVEGVQTELLDLSTMDIRNCIGCEACRRKKSLCVALEDDMEEIYPKLINCDALIVGSPVYFGDVTGLAKAFMDRTTCLGSTTAEELQYPMKWKIGGAIAVGAGRHGGQEYTLKTIHNFFLIHGMLVISGIPPSGYWGAAGWAIEREGILKDVARISTMEICEDLGWRVAVATKYFYEGKNNLGVGPLHFTKK